MRRSEQIGDLAAALAAIQAEVPAIPKDATNPFFKSRYADLPAVMEAASPIVTRHGVAVAQTPDFDGTNDLLTTLVMHTSGQWIESSMRLHLVKDDPQSQGSAITYARRYSYMSALGLVADEDDDGNAASKAKKPRQTPAPVRKEPAGMVSAADAKQRLVAAYGGSRDAARGAWADRGSNPISEEELSALLAAAESRPFEGGDAA